MKLKKRIISNSSGILKLWILYQSFTNMEFADSMLRGEFPVTLTLKRSVVVGNVELFQSVPCLEPFMTLTNDVAELTLCPVALLV